MTEPVDNPTWMPKRFTDMSSLCRSGNGWWWVPLVAPLIGGVLGAGLYKAFVEMHHRPLSGQDGKLLEESENTSLEKQENISAIV